MPIFPYGVDLGVFDLNKHHLICQLKGRDFILTSAVVCVEPLSKRLLVIAGDNQGYITIWDLDKPTEPILYWQGHNNIVTASIVYCDPISRDLRLITTAFTMQIWDLSLSVKTLKPVQLIACWTHKAPIDCCAVYLDNLQKKIWLASCDRLGNIFIGNLPYVHTTETISPTTIFFNEAYCHDDRTIIFCGFHRDKNHKLYFISGKRFADKIEWRDVEQPEIIARFLDVNPRISEGAFYTRPDGNCYIITGEFTSFSFYDFINPVSSIQLRDSLVSFFHSSSSVTHCQIFFTEDNPLPKLLLLSQELNISVDINNLKNVIFIYQLLDRSFAANLISSTAGRGWHKWDGPIQHAFSYYNYTLQKTVIVFNDIYNRRYFYDAFQLSLLPQELLREIIGYSSSNESELAFYRKNADKLATINYYNHGAGIELTCDPFSNAGISVSSQPSCGFVYYDEIKKCTTCLVVGLETGALLMKHINTTTVYQWQGHDCLITCCALYKDKVSQRLHLISCDVQGKISLWDASPGVPRKIFEWQSDVAAISCCAVLKFYLLVGDIKGNVWIYSLSESDRMIPPRRGMLPALPKLFYLIEKNPHQTYLNVLTNEGYVYSINWNKLWQARPVVPQPPSSTTLRALALKQVSRNLRYDKIATEIEGKKNFYPQFFSQKLLFSPEEEFTLLSRLMGERKEYFANLPREIGGTSPLILMCEKCRRKKYLCVC